MSVRQVRFKQVDVFGQTPFKGNPLAVIFDADGLSGQEMQTIARWTNLSETTFICRPTDPEADYLVRIFTPVYEMPFAGHPTLGTAHALLESGYGPRRAGRLIQQCGVGLVELAVHDDGSLAFVAPPARFAPLDADELQLLKSALQSDDIDFTALPPCRMDNGATWLTVGIDSGIDSPQACLAIRPDPALTWQIVQKTGMSGLAFYAAHTPDGPATLEVRCIVVDGPFEIYEDPVTGSANAGIACLLAARNRRPGASYTVRQGTAIGRDGRVTIQYGEDGRIWVGGRSSTIVDGTIRLG